MSGPPGMTLDLPDVRDCALFLDFDGTLDDLAPRPEQVSVPPDLVAHLGALQEALGGRLAVISGRPIAELDGLLAPLALPAAGVHGMERRGADGVLRVQAAAPLDDVRVAARALCVRHPGLWLEEKRGALALHYRQVPELRDACHAALADSVRDRPDLMLMQGKMIIEIKAAGIDKGTAIREFLAEPPFAGHRALFAGDDTTDETGFAYVQRIGGAGLKVGAGDSVALHRIPSARALRAELARLVATLAYRKEPT